MKCQLELVVVVTIKLVSWVWKKRRCTACLRWSSTYLWVKIGYFGGNGRCSSVLDC
ncbi:unnamed protein product [Strongylus vulgaris]|uniref:Uncharacterized protein n=1 Tax=Strongylus vulgaris TaxID=40348 RepID=A0A3P7IQ57_STRVU|nr:unnamed protein product [Strongylus vulgaris]